tara:strand:+ start:357 stop:1556 length:1200 start_codon:yes stop_codon:yes gene_type:complete
MKPKYSVIIPSRNGIKYLHHSILSVLNQKYDDFELLVSINNSNDNSLEELKVYKKDNRFKLINNNFTLPMAKHYERCLNYVNGDWIILIGDDDGLMSNFFIKADSIINKIDKDAEAIIFSRAMFFWPGCQTVFGNTVVNYNSKKNIINLDGIKLIKDILVGKKEHYELPQLYTNNIIKFSLIKKIKKISNNQFYHEITPDVYSGVIISMMAKKIYKSFEPLFWTGTSPKSVGLQITNKEIKDNNYDRGKEHIDLSYEHGLKIAESIGINYWKNNQNSSVYVFSCLNNAIKFSFIKINLNKYLYYMHANTIFFKIYNLLVKKKIFQNNQIFEVNKIKLFKISLFSKLIYVFLLKIIRYLYFKYFYKFFFNTKIKYFISKDRNKFQNFNDINKYLDEQINV